MLIILVVNMIIKNATYKGKQHVHICWVFLAFKHQPNQQANRYNEGHHQKLWSTRNKDCMVNWEVHVKVTAVYIAILIEFYSSHSHLLA